jgi:hypothetical protein
VLVTAGSEAANVTGLHGLYDCARLSRELGISRKAAEAIMRRLPKQHVPDLRKVYVRAEDVRVFLDSHVVAA